MSGETLTYSYDAANRLTGVTGGTQPSTFAYDGDGNRVRQAVGSGTYAYTNDVASALPVVLQESGPDGLITYAYGLRLISESSSVFDYFYHPDGLGSTVGLTDATGTLRQGYAYDAWGNNAGTPNYVGTSNKFRYTGEALDPAAQLYYLRARYNDPSAGRFLGKDEFLGLVNVPLSLQRFLYTLNNPTGFTDPSGLMRNAGLLSSASVGASSLQGLRIQIPPSPMVANSALRDILLPLELGPIGLVPILVTPEQFKAARRRHPFLCDILSGVYGCTISNRSDSRSRRCSWASMAVFQLTHRLLSNTVTERHFYLRTR